MPERPPTSGLALSVKQPWAALLAAGVKTVEVRTWPTARRGTVFLHAAKVPDDRPRGWTFVGKPALIESAELAGGVIAVAELVDCVTYSTAEQFADDVSRHRNLPNWFRPPVLYGFVFEHVRPVPFRKVPGKTFFFPVSGMSVVPLSPGGEGLGVKGSRDSRNTGGDQGGQSAQELVSRESPSPLTPLPQGRGGPAETQLPQPAEPVIIIDPPEGKDARHHDHPQDARPAG